MPHDITVIAVLKVRAADNVEIKPQTIAEYMEGALVEPVENLEDGSYVVYGANVVELLEGDR